VGDKTGIVEENIAGVLAEETRRRVLTMKPSFLSGMGSFTAILTPFMIPPYTIPKAPFPRKLSCKTVGKGETNPRPN